MKMIRSLAAFLVLGIATSCQSTAPETTFFSNPHVQYHANGQKDMEVVIDRPGDGRILKWYENGQMFEMQEFRNHQYNGLHKRWNPKGVVTSVQTWRNGKRHGSFIIFRSDGSKYSEQVYRNGKTISQCWWDDYGTKHEGPAPTY